MLATEEVLAAYARLNDTTQLFPLEKSAATLFSEQVKRTPENTAVCDADGDVSYLSLEERVDRIAQGLIDSGCVPGDIVALLAERSAWYVAAVLAIVRAGCVYLPLGPDVPPDRNAQILADSNSRLLVVDKVDGYPNAVQLRALAESAPIAAPVDVDPESAAYVIYTSGSTGTPKGAVVHHRGMVNQLFVKATDLGLLPSDCIGQSAPQTFDISIWQMVSPLILGASVSILRGAEAVDPVSIRTAIDRDHITVLEIVPSLLRVLLQGAENVLTDIRTLVVTGEELPHQTAVEWFEANPNIPLVNAYGPTECSDDVSHAHIVQAPEAGVLRLPIGRPVANTQLWVVRADSSGGIELCGPGEPGELWVSGVGVGLGYLNDRAKSEVAFAPCPELHYGRIYRTGDIVVLDGNEMLTYLGRADRQVKLRGNRVELPEIEAVLQRHPSVRAAAVDVRKRGLTRRAVAREQGVPDNDLSVLVAYVVGGSADELTPWLLHRLPKYMVPERFVQLDEIPLTANGKVDYRALPAPADTHPELSSRYSRPVGVIETRIAEAWASTLKLERVGRHDDFFELSGESLMAMLIISRLSRAFKMNLTFTDLMTTRTPLELARLIRKKTNSNAKSPFDESQEVTPRTLSIHQEGVWFQWKLLPVNPYYNYQGTWTIQGKLDPRSLDAAWESLFRTHPLLRGRFREDDLEGVVLEYPWHPVPRIEVMGDHSFESFRDRARREAVKPFDLAKQPLLRAQLFRTASDRHELLLSTHEIMLDGWSTMVLTRELAAAYEAHLAGLPLADPSDDFQEFLRWESSNLTRSQLRSEQAFWKEMLEGDLPILDLPVDRPYPASPSFEADSVSMLLSTRLSLRLSELGHRNGVSLYTTLLAGYALLLARYSNLDEVIIGVPMANRSDISIQDTVGFILNMLPIRVLPEWDASFEDYLANVGRAMRAGLDNSSFPFPWMVQDKAVSTSSRSPIFQTMFNMLNYPEPPAHGGEATFAFNELDSGYTKYELSLYAQPAGDGQIFLQLSFQTELFDRATATRLFEGLVALYEDIASGHALLLQDVAIVSESHQKQLFTFGGLGGTEQ